jgi:hypothetical protein
VAAQWWELVIPAAAGVGGTALGSWLQGINGRHLFAQQSAEAVRAREEQAAQERLMRIYDQRRDAYAALLASGQRYHESLIDVHQRPQPHKTQYEELEATREEAEARRNVVLLLAPDTVIGSMADMLHDMLREPAEVEPHEFGWRVKAFMQSARGDLGVQPSRKDAEGRDQTP